MSESSTNSLDVEIVIVEGGPSLPPEDAMHPNVRLWLDYESLTAWPIEHTAAGSIPICTASRRSRRPRKERNVAKLNP